MKRMIIASTLLTCSTAFAVEGYEDIYIDREQDIIIHGIMCGKDLNSLNRLKPSYVFTNTDTISKGTYYYHSAYGNYSLTFNNTENAAVMVRGLLKEGQTKKDQMEKSVCLVSMLEGLPSGVSKYVNTLTLKANDPEWDKKMSQYSLAAGKPAYGQGVFQDDRTTAKFDKADEQVFAANQAYLNAIEAIFTQQYQQKAVTLPSKLEDAINYAHKTDGFAKGKTYPVIEEPAVWTKQSKERYNDLSRRRSQTMDWDIVIQENFDWYFNLVGKANSLQSTQLITNGKPQWNGQVLQQLATVQATYENGKSLQLDFLVTSSKVDVEIFDSMEMIKKKSHLVRNNPIASSKKPRVPVELPTSKDLTVYLSTEKEVIFFSPFRNKPLGDSYRYQ